MTGVQIGMDRAVDCFKDFIKKKKLRLTKQREDIVLTFLKKEGHLGIDELYSMLRQKNKNIGYATVWRTLNLLKEARIAAEVNFAGKKSRFEHLFGHEHHDHLICVKCGRCIEVVDPRIEKLQEKLGKKHSFKIDNHRMEIFGVCKKCQK